LHKEMKETKQQFLIRKHQNKIKRAHIWLGLDTACKMASTGGLKLSRYKVTDLTYGYEICKMCQTVFSTNL